MPRELPERPNLVHLKQQARDRLDALRQSAPDARLADALHAVAREYGFSTWPDLKAHVESVVREDPHPAVRSLAGRWLAEGGAVRSLGVAPPTYATLDVTLVGDRVTIVQSLVDGAGQEQRATSAFDADGQEHRYDDSDYGIKAWWPDRRTLEVSTTRDGKEVATVTYGVAPDDATLTVSAVSTAHDGFPSTRHHAVFSRQTFR